MAHPPMTVVETGEFLRKAKPLMSDADGRNWGHFWRQMQKREITRIPSGLAVQHPCRYLFKSIPRILLKLSRKLSTGLPRV